jgi:hypothetical protein
MFRMPVKILLLALVLLSLWSRQDPFTHSPMALLHPDEAQATAIGGLLRPKSTSYLQNLPAGSEVSLVSSPVITQPDLFASAHFGPSNPADMAALPLTHNSILPPIFDEIPPEFGGNLLGLLSDQGNQYFMISQAILSRFPIADVLTYNQETEPWIALIHIPGEFEQFVLLVPDSEYIPQVTAWQEIKRLTGPGYTTQTTQQVDIGSIELYSPNSADPLVPIFEILNRLSNDYNEPVWLEALLGQRIDEVGELSWVLYASSLGKAFLYCENQPAPLPSGTTCYVIDDPESRMVLPFTISDQSLDEIMGAEFELTEANQRSLNIIVAEDGDHNEYGCFIDTGQCHFRQHLISTPQMFCEADPTQSPGISCFITDDPDTGHILIFTISDQTLEEIEQQQLVESASPEALQQAGIIIAEAYPQNRFACFTDSGTCHFWYERSSLIPAGGDRERYNCSLFASFFRMC